VSARPARVGFLHTAAAHVARFDALVRALAPDVSARHAVHEDLLAAARRAGGVDAALEAKLRAALEDAAADGAAVVVCTCSTLGDAVERLGASFAPRTELQRLDRALARRAVEIAATPGARGRIAVVAALEVTVEPTCALIEDEARRHGVRPTLASVVVDDAWARFEAGDGDGYAALVANAARTAAADADVVVLAQASMEDAAARCADLRVPVLATPRLGVEAALAALRARAHEAS
jgi:hypothetical protein